MAVRLRGRIAREKPQRRERRPIERAYLRDLLALAVDPQAQRIARLIPALRAAIAPLVKQDQEGDDWRGVVRAAAAEASEAILQVAPFLAESTMDRVATEHGEDLDETLVAAAGSATDSLGAEQIREIMGVDPVGSEPWLRDALEEATARNVRYIKDLSDKMYQRLEEDIARDVQRGLRVESIAERIRSRYAELGEDSVLGMTQRRAALIAVDQVGKFHAEVDRRRQTDLGVEEYIWRTSRDERVRPEHARREGRRFSWSDPPPDGHPGDAIRCRCTAEPLIPGIDFETPEQPAVQTRRRPPPAPARAPLTFRPERTGYRAPANPAALTRSRLVHPETGLLFERSPLAKDAREVVVLLDMQKAQASLAQTPEFYVGPGGHGDLGRVPGVLDFIEKAKTNRTPVHLSRASVNPDTGALAIVDGRHRAEALRQLDVTTLPVSVDRDVAEEIRERFGASTTTIRPLTLEERRALSAEKRRATAARRREVQRRIRERRAAQAASSSSSSSSPDGSGSSPPAAA